MKPKRLRRFIKEILNKNPKGISYEDLLAKIWKKESNIPIKQIERALKKMTKWEQIKIVVPNRTTNQAVICRIQKTP